jgi:hypothetical protein
MFKPLRPILLISIGLAIAFAVSALTPPSFPWEQAAPTATLVLATTTAAVTPTGNSEQVPGGTSVILLLGTFLVVIIIAAILWHRRDWDR